MSGTYFNTIVFILLNITYFMYFKPKLSIEDVNNNSYIKYLKSTYFYIIIYFLFNILIQFVINTSKLSYVCGGNLKDNIATAAYYTFIGWTLVFGLVVLVINTMPGFKSVFSDIFGYYYVSSRATEVLTKLLKDPDINSSVYDDINKSNLKDVNEIILKITENMTIIINKIVPSNFRDFWLVLKPLMKKEYINEDDIETKNLKQQLLDLVIIRDNIGESFWYIYTAILIITIVQYNISKIGCKISNEELKLKYDKYIKDAENERLQTESANTKYIIN